MMAILLINTGGLKKYLKKNYLSILNNHQSNIAKFILNLTNIMMIYQKKLNRLLNNIILFQDIFCFGSGYEKTATMEQKFNNILVLNLLTGSPTT